MRKLRNIYADLLVAREATNINLEAVDPRTLAGHAARKRAAEESVIGFQNEYRSAVRGALAGLILIDTTPARAKRFIGVASSIVPLISTQADALYRDVAAPVAASMNTQGVWPRMMDTAQWNVLFAALRDKIDALGCVTLPSGRAMCYPDAGRHIPPFQSLDDVDRIIKGMIRNANGDEFNVVALERAFADAVFQIQASLEVDEEGAPEIVPAILTNVDPDEIQGLAPLFGRGYLVVNDVPRRDSIGKEYVQAKMEELRVVINQTR